MANFDLNLLVVFDTIMTERSVTRAAARLHLSQPAVSGCLSRLREMFEDELFVREKGNMEPTPRCLTLADPIRQIVGRIEAFRQLGRPFDPATTIQTFILAGSDYGSLLFGPPLVQLFQASAPLASLSFVENPKRLLTEVLAAGEASVAIDATHQGLTDDTRLSYLLMEDLVVIADRANPLISAAGLAPGAPITLDLLCTLPHAVRATRPTEDGVVSRLLTAASRTRTVAISVSQFGALGRLVSGTNLVACMPSLMAFDLIERYPITIYRLPEELGVQRYSLSLFWHRRDDDNAAHRWLRQSITDCARQIETARHDQAQQWLGPELV